MHRKIIIGSRGSELALWQARFFQSQLNGIGIASEIKIITTKGDHIQDLGFDKMEGKGFFTKEIEEALLSRAIDVAIHSHKDLETKPVPGLVVAGVSYRETPAELLLVRPQSADPSLPMGFRQGAVVGTSSARRKSQIKALRPDIEIKDIRGNVPTRINKLREGQFDAILLAAAGVHRLGLDLKGLVHKELDPRIFIPAPAQGVLAYQCRADDTALIAALRPLHHHEVQQAVAIERAILSGFGGGCHVPIGVGAQPVEGGFTVRVSYGDDWEKIPKRARFHAASVEEALARFNAISNQAIPKTALISRTLDSRSYLKRAIAQLGISLVEMPFIEIRPVAFVMPEKSAFDWVFFSSSNGVRGFFEHMDIAEMEDKKLAAFGESTALELTKFSSRVDFVATAGQPDEVAAAFKEAAGNERVLFAVSNISLNAISKVFDPGQITNVVVYETVPATQPAPPYDAYVFTSPSNVDAFLASGNAVDENAKVIAIGQSTANRLTASGIPHACADLPHEAELLALLLS